MGFKQTILGVPCSNSEIDLEALAFFSGASSCLVTVFFFAIVGRCQGDNMRPLATVSRKIRDTTSTVDSGASTPEATPRHCAAGAGGATTAK